MVEVPPKGFKCDHVLIPSIHPGYKINIFEPTVYIQEVVQEYSAFTEGGSRSRKSELGNMGESCESIVSSFVNAVQNVVDIEKRDKPCNCWCISELTKFVLSG